jgi:hypothetical protein
MTSFQWRQVDYPSGTGYVQTGGAYHESIEQFITEKLGGWSFEGSVFKATTAEIEDYYDCGKVEGDVTKPCKSHCNHGSCGEIQS